MGAVTRVLVLANLVVLGLYGSSIDRALVATPAWERLGPMAWAEFSRHADLGTGLIVYPIIGVLPTVLALAAAASYRLDRGAPRAAGPPIYLAALAMIGVMATTVVAAPIMLGLPAVGTDPVAVQQAFERFTLWGVYVRGGLFAVAFLASLWAGALLVRRSPARHDRPDVVGVT